VRPAIAEMVGLGSLPSEQDEGEESADVLGQFESLLVSVKSESAGNPLTIKEVKALVGLFGPDEACGLAWLLLHLIEGAPDWPVEECLYDTSGEWTRRLKTSVETARRLGILPVIDRFENGVVTSVKHLDLGAPPCHITANLERIITGYIDDVARYVGTSPQGWGGIIVCSNEIKGRALDLVISYAGSAVQQQVISRAVSYGDRHGVAVNVQITPAGG
jgi:hypothetical protein